MTERYVLPYLGRVPLRRLTIVHLERLYAELRTRGRQDGEPLAPKTVLNVHQVLRTALGDAERKGLVRATSSGSWIRRISSRPSSDAGTKLSYAPSSTSPLTTGSGRRCG